MTNDKRYKRYTSYKAYKAALSISKHGFLGHLYLQLKNETDPSKKQILITMISDVINNLNLKNI